MLPLINGVEYSWNNIESNLGGSPMFGITAISYKDEQEVENHYGAGAYPCSRSFGRIKCEASITLLASEFFRLLKNAPNGRLQEYDPFDLVVTYTSTPVGGLFPTTQNTVETHRVIIKNAQFKSVSVEWNEGDTKAEIELPLICSHIIQE